MDFMTVDKSTYLPVDIVEGYSSLIWTERYQDPGEFELKTSLVLETMALLPEKCLVTHRETDVVMMVETHSIALNAQKLPELTVKGRSLDSFLLHRHLEGAYPKKKYKMAKNYTAAEAASVILWNALVNTTENDVTRAGDEPKRQTLDTVPNVRISDSTTVAGTSKRRWLTGGSIYPQVIDLLRQNKLGIRLVRPPSSGRLVSVTTGDKGLVSYVDRVDTPYLRFDIYNGTDRRRQQTTNEPVVFHYAGDYMSDESYLFSIAEYDTMVVVVSGVGTKKYYRDRPNDAGLSSWDRRVIWVDGGDPDLKEIPDRPDDDATTAAKQAWKEKRDTIQAENATTRAEFLEDLKDKADAELDKHDRVKAFECKITTASPYIYQTHYDLGDKVTLIGEYDFDQTMRVVEYVRTEDANGDVGYPGLAAIDSADA